MLREKLKRRTRKSKSTKGRHRGGITRSSDEVSVMETEQRGYIVRVLLDSQPNSWEELLQVRQSRLVGVTDEEQNTGWEGLPTKSQSFLPSGRYWGFGPQTAGRKELYEPRGSRIVLGEPGGEIPLGHSTRERRKGHCIRRGHAQKGPLKGRQGL